MARPTPSVRLPRQRPARCQAGHRTDASLGFSGGKVHFVHVNSVNVELALLMGCRQCKGECGGALADHSRHEKIGGDEPPGELRPPGPVGLIEGYTLDLAILFCASALEKIAQNLSVTV